MNSTRIHSELIPFKSELKIGCMHLAKFGSELSIECILSELFLNELTLWTAFNLNWVMNAIILMQSKWINSLDLIQFELTQLNWIHFESIQWNLIQFESI